MGKKELRKELITKRDSLSNVEWKELSDSIQRTIIRSGIYNTADCILCYADYHNEVGTYVLIDDAILKGKEVYVPKVLEDFSYSCMQFYRIFSSTELFDGYKGIKEPVGNKKYEFDYEKNKSKNVLMLVPGVGFDSDNNRMGYGKGYYDTYLKDKPTIKKCGLCFDIQYTDEIPHDLNDIKMDFVVTEKTKITNLNKIRF